MSNPDNSNALAVSEGTAIELMQPTALQSLTRGEIDMQIATAHRYPRSMTRFRQTAIAMATMDESTAESCIYVRPVGGGKFAEGLSVRMAEIVGASYGNLRVGSMLIEQTERYVIARGFAHDLESNFMSSSEVKEPTVTKLGQPYGEAQRAVVAKAALAKARRDATFQVVPKALCRPIELAARQLIAGDAKSLETRRAAAVSWVQRLNINEDRVWKAVGVKGAEELTGEHLLTLTGIRNSIRDNDTSIDEAFPEFMKAGNVGGAAAGSVTESAKAEKEAKKPAEEKKPEEKKPEQKGPTVKELVDQVISLGGKIDAGRAKIEKAAKALRYMEPAEKLDNLTPEKLANIIDAWAEISDEIMNPGASK